MQPTWESDCGRVVLYHADCLEVLPTLEKGSIDAVVTDPPYGIRYRSNHRRSRHREIEGDKTTDARDFVWRFSLENARHSTYMFCRWDSIPCSPKSLVVWVKDNWSMGDLAHEHARQTELIAFAPGPEHEWPHGRPTDVVFSSRTKNAAHPTEKPVLLIEQILTWARGTTLDPFMGSGTTGVACIRTGRRFIGIEIDQHYFEVAKKRIQDELAKHPPLEAIAA